jgi:hypothetical protein
MDAMPTQTWNEAPSRRRRPQLTSGARLWSQSPPQPRSSERRARSRCTGLLSAMRRCMLWSALEQKPCGDNITNSVSV